MNKVKGENMQSHFFREHWFALTYAAFVLVNMHVAKMYLHHSVGHGSVVYHTWIALAMQAYLNINLGADALSWRAMHPIHHRSPDGEGDIHSPRAYSSLLVGFVAVLFGTLWLHHKATQKYALEYAEAKARYVPTAYDRLVARLTVPLLKKSVTSYGLAGLVLFCGVGLLYGRPGLGVLLWLLQAATTVLLFGLLNSWGHMASVAHPKAGHALNLPALVSPLFGGDARHKDHHLNPGKYFLGWADTGGWLIRGLIALGLAWPGEGPVSV